MWFICINMAEPKRILLKLSFDVSNPIRVHTDLSMFAQSPVKRSPDKGKIQKLRKLSAEFVIDRNSFSDFLENDEN